MRSNQQNKRPRGRSNNHNRKNTNPMTRSYESNGPDVRVRGNAAHVAEKYVQLSRDANSSGDSVAAENYLQHAEHYFRIIFAAQANQAQQQANQQAQQQVQQTQQQTQNQSPLTGQEQSDVKNPGKPDDDENRAAGEKPADQTLQGIEPNGIGDPESAVKQLVRERRPRRRPVSPPKAIVSDGPESFENAVEKTVVEKLVVEKLVVEKLGVEKLGVEKTSVEKTAVDKTSVEKTAVDPASAPQPDVSELPAFVTDDIDGSAAK